MPQPTWSEELRDVERELGRLELPQVPRGGSLEAALRRALVRLRQGRRGAGRRG